MNQITSAALLELAIESSKSLNSKDRFTRLLDTVRKTIVCDAVVLLSFHGDRLKPIALQGLSADTLGRRFIISEHPRFEVLCKATTVVRFEANSPLPDPYDGLLSDREGDLPVHACMGLPLYFNNNLIGLLTIDSLTPHVFDNIPGRTLEVINAIAATSLNTALMLEQLEQQAIHNHNVMTELTQEALLRDGGEIIGTSDNIVKLKQEIDIVSGSDFNVLIHGESGVGKELVARTLHKNSPRQNQPLVYVNCAALPDNLIESELFGHVKGAFTGAEHTRAGKFSLANGGILFLDEIGELPLSAQSKILRAIQNNEIQPVGQDKIEYVDVLIIAATNRNLKNEVERGHFRSDLYHRLNVYPITVPPLRDRIGDVQILTGYFIEQSRRKLGIAQLKVTQQVIKILEQYDWPGNVRELEHVISRSALKAKSRQRTNNVIKVEVADCDDLVSSNKLASNNDINELSEHEQKVNTEQSINLRTATEDFQRNLISSILYQEQGNWAATARRLHTDRANLNRIAKRLNIKVLKVISEH
ncbi:nitric oxide reductase transcriptional regulator NorR [Thalassotalea fonticola]|uniref:Nitric oxide reductase transcriptional regulator NorR n=1 Tax=Thalassotalea fonticola TaxID=3065649 RepID=A0ABZ0GSK9_9GAMM|nr:nitric oxide reductase transcriptional regulator NorR [Colwelliaceae bacterium S1-1]